MALPFDSAVLRAAGMLLSDAQSELAKLPSKLPRPLVIDPLIDASTGQQTIGTQQMGTRIAALVQARYGDAFAVKPFERASLDQEPLLLMGTLTAVNKQDDVSARADVFRIWLTMVDLATGRVIAKALGLAAEETVDATPTPMYRDSPTWPKDASVNAYIESCQANTRVGDPIEPAYLRGIDTSALIAQATTAYDEGRVQDAFAMYSQAASSRGGADQLRVLNGLYLSAWNLGKQQEASATFGRIVALGLHQKKLGVKFLFQPNSTDFLRDPKVSDQYPIWINQIAAQSALQKACLRIVGHTSKTGSAAFNDALSARRASMVQRRLESLAGGSLRNRTIADGMGFRETLVGIGTDDLRDALDRRVEFHVVDCPARAR